MPKHLLARLNCGANPVIASNEIAAAAAERTLWLQDSHTLPDTYPRAKARQPELASLAKASADGRPLTRPARILCGERPP